ARGLVGALVLFQVALEAVVPLLPVVLALLLSAFHVVPQPVERLVFGSFCLMLLSNFIERLLERSALLGGFTAQLVNLGRRLFLLHLDAALCFVEEGLLALLRSGLERLPLVFPPSARVIEGAGQSPERFQPGCGCIGLGL